MLIYGIGNLIVWLQLNGQFKWDFLKDNLWLGIPVAVYLFIFGLGMFKNVEAAEWNDKPVLCEQK